MDEAWLASRLLILIPLWLSLTVHEWAHAWAAFRLGDDTAQRMGRLTLNPLAHIDPVGTLLLPLIGVPFGWAKPVPVEPTRFDARMNMRTGMMLTALAGPIANVCLAGLCVAVVVILTLASPDLVVRGTGSYSLLENMIMLNVVLAAFNMLPIPPLDGSRVVDAIVPEFLRPVWEGVYSLGAVGLVAVILAPMLLGVDLFAWIRIAVNTLLESLTLGVGG